MTRGGDRPPILHRRPTAPLRCQKPSVRKGAVTRRHTFFDSRNQSVTSQPKRVQGGSPLSWESKKGIRFLLFPQFCPRSFSISLPALTGSVPSPLRRVPFLSPLSGIPGPPLASKHVSRGFKMDALVIGGTLLGSFVGAFVIQRAALEGLLRVLAAERRMRH